MRRSLLACGVVTAALFLGTAGAREARAQWNNVEQQDSGGGAENSYANLSGWSGGWARYLPQAYVDMCGAVGTGETLNGSAQQVYTGHVKNEWSGSGPKEPRYVRTRVTGALYGHIYAVTTGTGFSGGSSSADGYGEATVAGSLGKGLTVGGTVSFDEEHDETTESGNVGGFLDLSDAVWNGSMDATGEAIVTTGQGGSVSATYSVSVSNSPTYTTPSPTTDDAEYWSDNTASIYGYIQGGGNGTATWMASASAYLCGCVEWW